MKTFIEPFRIKMVEPIKMTTREERIKHLEDAHQNIFLVKAENVMIDLLTDSGTGAMSARQWASMMEGDESYASCRSYYDFEASVQDLTGFKHVFPTHQGRAAEKVLFGVIGKEGKIIPNNNHFDTTRANIEATKTVALDLVIDEGKNPALEHPFKGNMDLEKLRALFQEHKGTDTIPICMLTLTNNTGGGQPVSMENIRGVRAICDEFNTPLYFDCCRFAENAYFIKMREEGFQDKSIKEIVREMFSHADGATMSSKKDALVNMGGFIAFNDDSIKNDIQNHIILGEGFPTYGGLAGRDLAALATGLQEGVNEDYLKYRIESTAYLGEALLEAGIPIVRPVGGHAVFVDAAALLPHIPKNEFPAQALCNELYLRGGIRGVEIGSFMFGGKDPITGEERLAEMELLRLAIPRRVYTKSHFDFVIETFKEIKETAKELKGYKVTYEPPFLRHFTAHLEQL